MRSLRPFLALAMLALPTPAGAALDLGRAAVTRLPNGLTVIMLEDHSLPVVSVQMLYKSGSAAETRGKTGLAHFLEHLAFRGSASFPAAGATERIYDSGGEWHGYTAMDQTTYFATMPKDGLDLLLAIEADRMARTIIDPAAIEAEQGAVITELHGYENDPASVLQEAVTRTAIQAHPYGSPMAGYVSDVAGLTADDARAYYAGHYAPGNAVLAIAGDFAPAEARALLAKHFAGVPARARASPVRTVEPPQKGERRIVLNGSVAQSHFMIAYPAPAASSADFPAFIVLQQILSGTPGLNAHQDGWTITPASERSDLAGLAEGIGTWLPVTRDPFLFSIGGSVAASGQAAVEQAVERRLAVLRDRAVDAPRLAAAKSAVIRALAEDVLTTEDAAHQLAFFEGVGALDALLDMPARIGAVTGADVQRVARTYLVPTKRTIGWMVAGPAAGPAIGGGLPTAAGERPGVAPPDTTKGEPVSQRLEGALPLFVQSSPLSDTVTVELLLSGPVDGGTRPEDLPGLDTLVRSGRPSDLAGLIDETIAAARGASSIATTPSQDPATRLEQLIAARMATGKPSQPQPVALAIAGNVDPKQAPALAAQKLGHVSPASLVRRAPSGRSRAATYVRERIALPLAQGALGYVVEGPAAGTKEALAWRMLLYVLAHDYSGRLGRSAIGEKGLVYYIGSAQRSDGARTWATLSIGVDPDKADAMEAELRAQLAGLRERPPTAAEVAAARRHLIGRDLSAAQSNVELAAKLTRQFVDFGGPLAHDALRARLDAIGEADLRKAARDFARGAIVRVDVAPPPQAEAARPTDQ